MQERFKQWTRRMQANKRWVIGAIATPACLGMVGWLGLLPEHPLQPDGDRPSHTESDPLTQPPRKTLINGIGTMVMVAGGVFLLFNFRPSNRNTETISLNGSNFNGADLSGTDLSGAEFCGANLSDANLSSAEFCGANFSGADLSGTNFSEADLSGANLSGANLSGANLSRANLRFANLDGANLRFANLSGANLKFANLSGADLNCTLLSDANLSDANLSRALLFFVNSREVQNLEPVQLKAKPSPFLCNVALPCYSQQPDVNPNRDCDRIPQLLSDRYHISLEEAQGIVNEARQHRWD
ncbi:pentapeptide repeat-containing protein [Leptolyngbya sp. AN02str]|uniref:pentapeptide repeat-containing protein n=1 Tax=Leptolyngbya sp. AN02str TaxID=3423363 RepID=UPI003D31AC66